uniref:Dynactin subunit 4 n=1 Tax=Eptatretus burgeri TaxID=7764 RepID=A0A8C4Q071_EPTBU
MASLLQTEKVLYLVQGERKIRAPLSQLYFCRHCYELRSLECVSHEVDSHFCPSCLESMPSAEAKLKKNRCANCFDCPCCSNTLSTRATPVHVPSPDDPSKSELKKAYYLACGFCHWTSRDVAMPDKAVASGGWQDPDNPFAPRIQKLLEYYRHLAQREKLERDRRKLIRRRNFLPLTFSMHSMHGMEKYSAIPKLKKQFGMSTSALFSTLTLKDGDDHKEVKISNAETVEEVEPLSEDYYTHPVQLEDLTNLPQRLVQIESQSQFMSHLYPRHKHLIMKRSLRCIKCEHNLSKPEFNPTSIRFKIQLVALSYIPEVRIMSLPNLRYQKESRMLLTLTNPMENRTHVTLKPCAEDDPDDVLSTAKVVLPDLELLLAARDAAAEYDDLAEPEDFKDDPDIVSFRKANKLGIFVTVIPQRPDGDVHIAFKLQHDFYSPASPLKPDSNAECSPVEPVWPTHHVDLALGPLAN